MNIKFDKYRICLGKAEHTILVPKGIDTLQWNTIGSDWGNELIGDRSALYAVMYTCAVLMFDERKLIYFPIRKNKKLDESFWDYSHDVVFTCNKSNFHVDDWKEYRRIMTKMKPETYEFSYDRKRIDEISAPKDEEWHEYKKRERAVVGYEKDKFETWFVAMDSKAYSRGYHELRKLADKQLEQSFIKNREYPPYEIFLTYELTGRYNKSYYEEFCYCFMFYDPALVAKAKEFEEAKKAAAPVFTKTEKKKLMINDHDTTKTKRQIKNANYTLKNKSKKKKKEDLQDDITA